MNFILLLASFFTPVDPGGFFTGVNDSKSPKVSWTRLSIQADLNKALIRLLSIIPLISNSASLFFKSFGTIPSALTIIGIPVTFMFPSFFF